VTSDERETLDEELTVDEWASLLLAIAKGTDAWLLDQVERGTTEWDPPTKEG